MSKASDSAQVQAWVESGQAVTIQAHVTGGHITYEFCGGTYDGIKIRLYPPFSTTVVFGDDVYLVSPPKNGRSKRLTYRLQER